MSSHWPDQTSKGSHSRGFDSRAWTGPEFEPPRPTVDRKRARAAFRAAGGSAAVRPQRVASVLLWIGLASILALILLGLPGIDPWPFPYRWWEGARTLVGLEWATARLGADAASNARIEPDVIVPAVALLAGWAGILTAWTCRRALARGFRAAEADLEGAVFVTRRADPLAPGIGFLLLVAPAERDGVTLPTLVVLALLAIVIVRAMTAVAERRFAGLGARSSQGSRWDVAALVVSSAAMAMAMARALVT